MNLAEDLHEFSDSPARDGQIKIHDAAGFEGMRKAGRAAAETLDHIAPYVQPGVTTEQLDDRIRRFMLTKGGVPATLGYRGYTKSSCTSINHVVCHGIPGPKQLRNGDIVNIDVTIVVDGWHGDTSRMFIVGEGKRKAERLVEVTYEAMMMGINAIKPGVTLGTIGAIIQKHAEANRYGIVTDFCGHGLGRLFHDEPNVLHYGEEGEGPELREGMFFTVEPMLNLGRPDVLILRDGWTAVTKDKSLSAQFEHSVGVTADGVEIFTKSPAGLDCPPYAV
ncbi:MAG: type I methionyl aminopeptidase [Maricaulis sp.]|nr:type I methionyl aminopeptidase [Maricaulis sp.]HAQ35512.1 type I methionyl aminopeptidase [Alphaproteobacteria bacterium]